MLLAGNVQTCPRARRSTRFYSSEDPLSSFFTNQFTQPVCRRCAAAEHGNRASSSSITSSSVAEAEKWCHHNRSVSHWGRLKLALSVMHNSLSNLSVCSPGFLTLVTQRTPREMKVRRLLLSTSVTPILPKCPFNLCRQPNVSCNISV